MAEDLRMWAGPVMPPTPAELADRYAVSQLVKVYALGVDMRDYKVMRSAFTDDAYAEGTTFGGPIDEYLPRIFEGAMTYAVTQLNVTTQHVQLDGDEALVWSYAVAIHKMHFDSKKDELTHGLQYRDACRRTAQGWLIARREVVVQWIERYPLAE